jgi:large subunit ribosomal protein L28
LISTGVFPTSAGTLLLISPVVSGIRFLQIKHRDVGGLDETITHPNKLRREQSWPLVGNNVSHANNKTKRRYFPNLQYKRFWLESEKRFVRLRVSARGIRIIDKYGIEAVLKNIKLNQQIAA